MTRRAAALALVAAGALLALAAAGRAWLLTSTPPAPGLPEVSESLSGAQVAAPVPALALAALASAAALLAVRGAAARVVGALALLLGTATLGYAWAGARAAAPGAGTVLERTPWPWVTLAGALLVVAGGALALIPGGRWSGLSARHDAPSGAARTPGADRARAPATGHGAAWDALDRGEDPTGRPL